MAADIMGQEGYPDLKALGGVHDEGQDARVERVYYSARHQVGGPDVGGRSRQAEWTPNPRLAETESRTG
jgi:hypothetical protein